MFYQQEDATLRDYGMVAVVKFEDYELWFRRVPDSPYWDQTLHTHSRSGRRGYGNAVSPKGAIICTLKKRDGQKMSRGETIPVEVFRICARAARDAFWDRLSGRR